MPDLRIYRENCAKTGAEICRYDDKSNTLYIFWLKFEHRQPATNAVSL